MISQKYAITLFTAIAQRYCLSILLDGRFSHSQQGMELLMRYFISGELGVANLLQRHFDWSSNALWYEEIPNARDPSKTFFVLGGKDSIVNAEVRCFPLCQTDRLIEIQPSQRVTKYLRSHGVRDGLYLDPNGRHGQALITGGDGHNKILRWLREPEKL